jgi:glycosyltransferase involved in cell wall biosynthesis
MPSGMTRGWIYREYFQNAGYKVRFVHRCSPTLCTLMGTPPAYLRLLMNAGLRWLLSRIQNLYCRVSERVLVRLAKRYDVVYMSKITSDVFVERLKKGTAARLVLDFGDAVWLRGKSAAFDKVLQCVDAVTTDNEITAEYVRRVKSSCAIIPDCPQVELFDQRRTKRDPDPATITLGWIGSPSTLHNLYLIWEPLEKLFARHDNLHLRLVGTGPDFSKFLPPFERVRFSCRSRYGQAEMIEEVLKMDVGLFPLQDVEASRTRGVLKATVYMSGGAAVVCSPIGQCVDLIQEGVNGFLAATPEEWVRKIERLVESTALRQTVARNGLEQVRREFTVEKSFDKLIAVLDPDRAASP